MLVLKKKKECTADVEELVNTKAKEQLTEAENRAKRQSNLIIFKLPELPPTVACGDAVTLCVTFF